MLAYRINYKKTVAEIYVPEKHNDITVIHLPGLPGLVTKNEITFALVRAGCVVFHPQYSGSFDSAGSFSPKQCLQDVKKFIVMAREKSFSEEYFHKKLTIKTKKIVLLGSSYGSSIAALSVRLSGISGIVLLSPVLTYNQALITKEVSKFDFHAQMMELINLLQRTFPYTYRIKNKNLLIQFLLGEELEFDPIRALEKNLNVPLLLIHGKQDLSIPYQLSKRLLKRFLSDKSYVALFPLKVGHSTSSYGKVEQKKIVDFIRHI